MLIDDDYDDSWYIGECDDERLSWIHDILLIVIIVIGRPILNEVACLIVGLSWDYMMEIVLDDSENAIFIFLINGASLLTNLCAESVVVMNDWKVGVGESIKFDQEYNDSE